MRTFLALMTRAAPSSILVTVCGRCAIRSRFGAKTGRAGRACATTDKYTTRPGEQNEKNASVGDKRKEVNQQEESITAIGWVQYNERPYETLRGRACKKRMEKWLCGRHNVLARQERGVSESSRRRHQKARGEKENVSTSGQIGASQRLGIGSDTKTVEQMELCLRESFVDRDQCFLLLWTCAYKNGASTVDQGIPCAC